MLAALAARRDEADPAVAIDYALHLEIPTWHAAEAERLGELPAVRAAGIATYKLYQAYPEVILDDPSLYRALQAVAGVGGLAVIHSEVGPVIDLLRAEALAAGRCAPIEHERTRPAALEATAIHRAAAIALQVGCPILIFHVGNGPAVAAINTQRTMGAEIWGETCPQYLVLTSEEHLGGPQGNLYICAPPLRSNAHREAVWQALADGRLQVVSTDHCPWTCAEKAQPTFAQVPGGVPSIEARLALLHHFGVRSGLLALERWVEVCATAPARLMRLARKGRLEPGADADVVIFDPARSVTISQAPHGRTLHEAADWTPYEGITGQGWTRDVWLRGQSVVRGGDFVGATGQGRFVARH
ncbi:MAG: amidohydrolase family protein, partial [Caldilineaceae bacterium]